MLFSNLLANHVKCERSELPPIARRVQRTSYRAWRTGVWFVEQVSKESLGCREKITGDPIVIGVPVVDLLNRSAIKAQDGRSRKRQQQRRMGRDDKLRDPRCGQLMKDAEKRQLPLRRQGGFRFVEEIETIFESVLEQRQEGFAMRLQVERLAAIGRERAAGRLEICREVEEGLGAKEEARRGALTPVEPERATERVSVYALAELMIPIPALRAEANTPRQRLEERRLPGTVLADEKGYRRGERETQPIAKERNIKGMDARLPALLPEGDAREKWASWSATHHAIRLTKMVCLEMGARHSAKVQLPSARPSAHAGAEPGTELSDDIVN